MPGTVSRRAVVGPAGGLSWLQLSGVIKHNHDQIPVTTTRTRRRVTMMMMMMRMMRMYGQVLLSTPQDASNRRDAVTVPTPTGDLTA